MTPGLAAAVVVGVLSIATTLPDYVVIVLAILAFLGGGLALLAAVHKTAVWFSDRQ